MSSYQVTSDDLRLKDSNLLIKEQSIPIYNIETITIKSPNGTLLYTWTTQSMFQSDTPPEVRSDGSIVLNDSTKKYALDIKGSLTLDDCTISTTLKEFIDTTLSLLPAITSLDIILNDKRMIDIKPNELSIVSYNRLNINRELIDVNNIKGIRTFGYQGQLAQWVKQGTQISWDLNKKND